MNTSASASTVWYSSDKGATVEVSLTRGEQSPTLKFTVDGSSVELSLDPFSPAGRRALGAVDAFGDVLRAAQRAGLERPRPEGEGRTPDGHVHR